MLPGSGLRAKTSGTLSGRAVGPSDEPIVGARIWVKFYGTANLAEDWTDSKGRFCLGPIEPVYRHRFDLLIEADGYACQYVPGDTYSVFPGVDCNLGDIRLDWGRVFVGRVVDVDGKGASSATVEYEADRDCLGHTSGPIGPPRTLQADSEGWFRTAPLPVGRLYLKVRSAGRQMAWQVRSIEPGGEEHLDAIRLEIDVPIAGVVQDDEGRPIEGASIQANDVAYTTSDSQGNFTLRGFGPQPRFQLRVQKERYVGINWAVVVREDGLCWREARGDGRLFGPLPRLGVAMKPVAWIEGSVVDADTGEPVHLDKVVLCYFERTSSGEVKLSGCRDGNFEQPESGQFRIPYSHADEMHLSFSASGYDDAEAFTPKVTELQSIGAVKVKMKKQSPDSKGDVRGQSIRGTVNRDGRRVTAGWVGVWALSRGARNLPNAYILRGRTVEGEPHVSASAVLQDGAFMLDVPFPSDAWYVVAETPGHTLTQVGPISVALNEAKTLDIACVEGGGISGTVNNPAPGWKGHLWVVAFSATGIRVETRIRQDGEFSLHCLPPGKYGLKVGHDAYQDSEVPRGNDLPEEAWTTLPDPWKRATIVEVLAGRDVLGIELELPGIE